ncbi:IPTL-CTERM sorting domain-containing protein [Brevundimonas staleyi]|uniref:IPTL-CTERM sorting domain-containing protein n=1 Tax=Brevundimonas staleyi TaxID=74326 RepID=A0ABW0FY12_9CAUL
MFKMLRALVVSASIACGLAASAAMAAPQTVYEFAPTERTATPYNDGILASITVAAPTDITAVAQRTLASTSVNVKFLVVNTTTNTVLYSSAAKTFPSDGGTPSFKQSDDFAPITLLPGNTYAIGLVSEQPQSLYYQNAAPPVQNGISMVGFSNAFPYANPAVTGVNPGLGFTLKLVYEEPPVSVPTLSEWSMILLGLLMAGAAALHLQRRRRLIV